MFRLISVRQLILPLLLAMTLAGQAAWQEKQIHGRGYVSIASMKSFYSFDQLRRSGKSVVLEKVHPKSKKVVLDVSVRIGSTECLMNGIKFIFSYPVEDSGGKEWISKIDLIKLVDPVLRPKFIGSAGDFRTVIIDPGHGGKDPGATNSLGTEAAYNLKVAMQLKQLLEREYKYKVVMTRESNVYLTLQQRVDIANRISEEAIFVSIHHNSGQSRARGIETFTLSPVGVSHYGSGLKESDFRPKTGNTHDSANVALATSIHGMLLSTLKDTKTNKSYTLDRGIKRARFSVLSGVRHPSVLIECGFMSNSYEARLINDPGYQRTLAKSIAFAVNKYRFAVGGGKR